MDADLQHPPDLIPLLLQKWEEGTDIVYTIRKEQTDLSLLKEKHQQCSMILSTICLI